MSFQPVCDDAFQRFYQRLVFQFFDDFGDKSLNQKRTRLVFRNAASPQIIEMVLVDIGNRCAMRALNIIGKDFKLRFDRKLGFIRQKQSIAGHTRISFLRVGCDPDLALENTLRAVKHDRPDGFRRGRIWYVMAQSQRHIRMAFAAQQIDAAQHQIRALAFGNNMDFLTDQFATSIDDKQA